MIDPDILRAQEEADWTDRELLEHVCDYVDSEASTMDLLTCLYRAREDILVARAEKTEAYQRCERFILEVFPKADDPAAAVTQFLGVEGSSDSVRYITMVARKHREDPRISPILAEFKKALLG